MAQPAAVIIAKGPERSIFKDGERAALLASSTSHSRDRHGKLDRMRERYALLWPGPEIVAALAVGVAAPAVKHGVAAFFRAFIFRAQRVPHCRPAAVLGKRVEFSPDRCRYFVGISYSMLLVDYARAAIPELSLTRAHQV